MWEPSDQNFLSRDWVPAMKGKKSMKKLMFAIAAVAAGAVFAEEAPAVQSANIVG